MIKTYLRYIHENPDRLWFKRKWYGWGWTPVRWQGWLVTLIYIGLVIRLSRFIDASLPIQANMREFVIPVLVLTAAFLCVAYATGEKPRWQWGAPKE
ncbi:MAG: hypothetical protein QY311_00600 [Candidatus Paceibacterota bacterium]|nr:MAG: hypothetical protein QY311_00600 [Candidatus Paceibacterota bacterium]